MKISNSIFRPPLLIFIVGLVLAVSWGINLHRQNQDTQRVALAELTDKVSRQLQTRLSLYEFGLSGARGAIAAAGGESITGKQFLKYIETRNIESEFPGARGFGFIRRVPAGKEQAFIDRVRREGAQDFQVRQLAPHDGERYVIQFIEPVGNNRQAVGLDIASERFRRDAARRAMQTGQSTLTAPITLVQASGEERKGFLLLEPIHSEPEAYTSVQPTQENTYGWVYSPLVIDEVLADFDYLAGTFGFALSDVTAGHEHTDFFESPGFISPSDTRLTASGRVTLYGRDWQIEVSALPAFVARLNLTDPLGMASVIVLIFALLAVMAYLYLQGLQRELHQLLSTQIGDAAPEAMLVADDSGYITYVNDRTAALFGYARGELEGQEIEILLPEQLRHHHASVRQGYDHIPRQMGAERYLLGRRKDGTDFPVEISLGSWQSEGRPMVVAMIVDVTERRQIENALHRSEERWRFALEGSGDGVWDWDLQAGSVSLSPAGAEMFGLEENEIGSNISDWSARLTPEDRLRWEEELRRFFRNRADRFSLEYRVRCKDGSYKWVLTRGMVASRSADGRVARMIGVHTDINDRKNAEVALAKSEERFRETLNQAPALVWIADAENKGIWYNQRWLEYTGRSMEQELGFGWMEGMHPDDRERCGGICQTALDQRERFEMELRLCRADGSYGWIVDTGIPRFNAQGDFDGYIGYCWDITDRKLAEQALQESERKFRTLSENIPGMLYRGDSNWQVEYISNCTLLCGYTASELQEGKTTWLQLIHPDDRESVLNDSAGLSDKPSSIIQEYRIQRKDGEVRWVSDHKQSIFNNDGSFVGVDGVVFDITDRKYAEREMALSKERLRRGQMFANIGTWDWNIESGELIWSERIAPLFGYPAGDLETSYENFINAVHPDDRKKVNEAVSTCVEADVPYDIEHRVVWPDGTVRWLQERGAVVRDAVGKPLQMLGVVQDIHDRKLAEIALIERERQLREAQTLAHIGNWRADFVSGELVWSDEIYRIFGHESGSFKPSVEAFHAAVHPDDRARVSESEKEAERTGIHDVVHRIIRPDGTVHYVHELARTEVNVAGEIISMIGTVQDITDRVEAENKLSETEERFSFAVEGAGDGIWDWNILTGEMPLSGHYETMLGYQTGELEPTIDAWVKSVHPDDLPVAQSNLQEYLQGKMQSYTIELRLHCKDDSYKWVLCRGTVVQRDAQGKPTRMIGIHTDINQRKMNEERLALFARVFDAAEGGVGITDAAGSLIYVNRAHEQLFGYKQGEMIGMHVSGLHPETEAETLGQLMGAVATEGSWRGLLNARRKDGSELVTTNSVGAIRDEQGKPRFLFNLMYDYAPEMERQSELRTARDNAESANRAKSEFLSSMSHELRTPLNAVIGFGQLLESDAQLGSDQQDSVQEIIKAGHHLLGLVNEVLDLARIESGNIDLSLEPVGFNEVVDECCRLIKPLADGRGITLVTDMHDDLFVRADRVRFKQVLLNLVSNAVKYNRERGSIRLSHQTTAQGYLRISVSDTGQGIPAERMGELFQPFNRLGAESSAVEGTGIGLSITQRLVEMMGGSIGAESELGKGSTFWLDLPLAQVSNDAYEKREYAGEANSTSENHDNMQCVLYIEDNPANLKLVSQILAKRSYIRLLTAHTPELGLDLAAAHRPDLILLDINMPSMDGYQVLKELKGNTGLASIPVIAVTANAMPRDIQRGMAAGFLNYLTKPLDVQLLLKTVDETLPQSSGHVAKGK